MHQEQIPSINWESKEMISALADKVETLLPITDEEKQLTISKIIVDENVSSEVAPFVHKKISEELARRKEEFYKSVGGKKTFERGAKRNALRNEIPEDNL
jgi:hypothetical protein